MLDGVGLIHMRGRVYDPTVGRFLSVDPIVRDIDASQSWNGYGYVEGRVASATDPTGYAVENVTVTGKRIQYRQDPPTIGMEMALVAHVGNRGAGQGGGRGDSDCLEGLEEVVVDGQRGQPPVPVVPLTFVPLSITPPNSARLSRLLNAAEAENRNCMTNCMNSKKPYIYAFAAAAGAATTRNLGWTAVAAVAGGLAGLSDSQGHNPFGSGTFAVAAAHVGELFRNPTGMGAFVIAPGAVLGAELVGRQFSGARGVLAGSAAGGVIDSIPATVSLLRSGATRAAGFRFTVGTIAPAIAAVGVFQLATSLAESDCKSDCGGP